MVKQTQYAGQKHFTYKMHNLLDHIESKSFHMIKNTKKEIKGQLLVAYIIMLSFPKTLK